MSINSGAWEKSRGENLLVRFFKEKVALTAKMREHKEKTGEDVPLWEWREFVGVRSPGDHSQEFIEWIDLRKGRSDDWTIRFAEQYARFKANQDQQVVGTPLSNWPGVAPSQVKMLEHHNIFSVEHLAEASDTAIQKIGMDGFALRKSAQAFLLKTMGMDRDKDALRAELANQQRLTSELQQQVAALMSQRNEPPRAKPGRKPKAQADAAPVAA